MIRVTGGLIQHTFPETSRSMSIVTLKNTTAHFKQHYPFDRHDASPYY
jgi:hypothetical protein